MDNVFKNEEKTFFSPGDLVTLRQPVPNAPIMIVDKIERYLIKKNIDNPPLRGIRTRWFTKNGELQEAVFSTKDLILVNNE
jgi:hypothetical protein